MRIDERLWQITADLTAATIRLVPRSMRYRLAVAAARSISSFIGPRLMKRPHRYRFSTFRDETIRSALRTMSRRGVEFVPNPRIDASADLIQSAQEQGAIIVSAHFPLNGLGLRYLHDHGCQLVTLRGIANTDPYIWGTRAPLLYILPSPTILATIRERMRLRQVVIMTIDRAKQEPRTTSVETSRGIVHVATPIFEFARRIDTPLYFQCVRTDDDGEVVVRIQRIEPTLAAFTALLREEIDALHD